MLFIKAATASFFGSETKINTANALTGPLLITSGQNDNIAPPILGKAWINKNGL